MSKSTKKFAFFKDLSIYFVLIYVFFQLVAFAREHIWHKAWTQMETNIHGYVYTHTHTYIYLYIYTHKNY